MCAAYCAANNATNDNDDDNDDSCNPPLRVIPRHLRDSGLGTIFQLHWLLVCRRGVRVTTLLNGERSERGSEECEIGGGMGTTSSDCQSQKGGDGEWCYILPAFLPVSGQEFRIRGKDRRARQYR